MLRTSTARRLITPVGIMVLLLSLLPAPTVEATDGYLIHGIGTKAKGMAGAAAAFPQDALAAGANPAGMAFVGKRYDVGAAWFSPRRSYTVEGNPSGFQGTFGLAPGKVNSNSESFIVPNFGANWLMGENSTFGLSIYGQGGMNTDYPARTFFGSRPTGVNLSQLFVVPTFAFKFGEDRHAFGISPILAYQTFEAKGLQAFGMFSSAPTALTNNGADSSIGYGARLGYMGKWSSRFSFGASYQSEISMDEFSDYAGLFAERGGFDIPSNYVLGIAYEFSDKVTAAFDYKQINYSDVRSVSNPFLPNFATARLGDNGGAGFGWEDTTVYKFGIQFEGSETWTWRFGYSTLDQPIPPSEVLFNILAPGVVEDHFTFGFTKELGKGELNLALMYAPDVDVTGPNPLDVPGFQSITLEMSQWDVEIGYSWGF